MSAVRVRIGGYRNKTWPGMAGVGTRRDRARIYRHELGTKEPDRAGQDWTGQDRSGQGFNKTGVNI